MDHLELCVPSSTSPYFQTQTHLDTSRSGQLIMGVTYGIKVDTPNHTLIRTAQAVMRVISVAFAPLMWILNPSVVRTCASSRAKSLMLTTE